MDCAILGHVLKPKELVWNASAKLNPPVLFSSVETVF